MFVLRLKPHTKPTTKTGKRNKINSRKRRREKGMIKKEERKTLNIKDVTSEKEQDVNE